MIDVSDFIIVRQHDAHDRLSAALSSLAYVVMDFAPYHMDEAGRDRLDRAIDELVALRAQASDVMVVFSNPRLGRAPIG